MTLHARPAILFCLGLALFLLSSGCGLVSSSDEIQATVSALATENAQQATQISAQATLISHLATRGPARVPLAADSTPTPHRPVHGSVQIEGGQCCIGGKVGETVEIEVAFEASSPLGEVTDMRARVGALRFSEEELAEAEWEQFVNQKAYPLSVALNWVGYYVSVQFRDEAGNLSPVYYDDISVEGQP